MPTAVGILGGSLLPLELWGEQTGDQGVDGQEESGANKVQGSQGIGVTSRVRPHGTEKLVAKTKYQVGLKDTCQPET